MNPPDSNVPIVDADGYMTNEFRDWTLLMTRLDILESTGNPEGVTDGFLNQICKDTLTGAIYIKNTVASAKNGWILV